MCIITIYSVTLILLCMQIDLTAGIHQVVIMYVYIIATASSYSMLSYIPYCYQCSYQYYHTSDGCLGEDLIYQLSVALVLCVCKKRFGQIYPYPYKLYQMFPNNI